MLTKAMVRHGIVQRWVEKSEEGRFEDYPER
jgi:hypothetical protein